MATPKNTPPGTGKANKSPTPQPPAADPAASNSDASTENVALPLADALKVVKRTRLVLGKDGKPAVDKDGKATGETEEVDIAEDEVFAWTLRGELVTVVTIDGQKFTGAL